MNMESILLQKKAMSRGLLWLDENVQFLEDLLLQYNFRVKVIPPGTKDEQVKDLVEGRVFITANSKDFIDEIDVYLYCLVAVDNAPKDPIILAKAISDAWRLLHIKGRSEAHIIINANGDAHVERE